MFIPSARRRAALLLSVVMLAATSPVTAKTRKGDRLLTEGRSHEEKKEWDAAVRAYEAALSEDPSEVAYQIAAQKARFEASAAHLSTGTKVRSEGQLGEALVEFQKAFALNPGSSAAEQEIRRTLTMIERERKRLAETSEEAPPEVRGLTPVEEARREAEERIGRLLPPPELDPLKPAIQDFKINNQPPKLLFDTLALNAGLNVVYDAEYLTTGPKEKYSVSFVHSTVEEALDYVAVITKSYWKALSPNTIFVTMDTANKRRDYEDEVARVFFLANTTSNAELTTLTTAVRTVADCQRVFPVESQSALVVKCSGDKIALVEKLLHDLDKPRAEVLLDIFVMEVSSTYVRNLTTAIASTGLNMPVSFTPRSAIQTASTTSTTTTSSATTSTSSSSSSTSSSSTVPLSHLGQVNAGDYSTVLPGALFQATLSDTRTKVLQAPQIRSVDGQKATMKIGEKEPTAQGSSQSSLGTVTSTGLNALVNTQFTYLDVGVNVEVLPHVHENGEISLHVSLDISNVTGTKNLGGIDEPIIGQRKIEHDIRLREGEVSLLGGLLSLQDSKVKTGVPGLASVPLLGRLFSGESVDRERDELMVALVPHVVRRPDITAENLRGVNTGPGIQLSVRRGPKPVGTLAAKAAADAVPEAAPVERGELRPPATAPPEDAGRMRFRESQVEKKVGEVFSVTMQMEGGADVGTAPVALRFDPNVLSLEGVTPGSGWGEPEKAIQNDIGQARLRLSRRAAGGTGELLTLKFRAVHSGTATVSAAEGASVVVVVR